MSELKDFLLGFGGILIFLNAAVWSLVLAICLYAGMPFWGGAFMIANLSCTVMNLLIAVFYATR